MHILVINCGSSSVKAAVVDSRTGQPAAQLTIERLGDDDDQATMTLDSPSLDGESSRLGHDDHEGALGEALPRLLDQLTDDVEIAGVGHRVVHGGERFHRPTRIDDEVEAAIEALVPLAPLHNPNNLAGIRAARRVLADVPHVAVFDTGFHATLPRRARAYALPADLAAEHGVRRYGFHGISHGYVAARAAEYLDEDLRELRVITCHLGNGCSLAAVEYGRSIETSMGMTPLEGLVMGTRSGDVDPGALIHLLRQEGWDVDRLDALLNRDSGLEGLSGVSNDLRDIEARAAEGDEDCRLAIQVFAHRVRKYIGAYAAVLGGVDAIVFTAGIGQNSALMRHRIAQRLDFLGARFDEDKNRDARVDRSRPVYDISAGHSRCRLLVVATDEQHAIAQDTARIIAEQQTAVDTDKVIPIAISARHVHLRQETIDGLFGAGHELTPYRELSQPGQYASEEKVTLIGPKRTIEGVRILGPPRSADQVEIARTDEFHLGLDAPVRGSGDVDNTPGITLEGPNGRVHLEEGVICALRHIHMTPTDARNFGVEDGDLVEVAVTGGERDLIFGDVLIRVSPKYKLEMHIDTDEGNAANLSPSATGTLMPTGGEATLRRREARYDEVAE